MAIWIQSLSWTLICSLGQGIVVYTSLWLVLKLMPAISANAKYHLSLSALTILLGWFVATLWQQFHSFALANQQLLTSHTPNAATILQPSVIAAIESYNNYHSILSSVKAMLPWLSVFYLIGLVCMLVRLSLGMAQIFSFRTSGVTQPGAALDKLLVSVKNKLHFEGYAKLFISAKAQMPMVIGFLKPVILVPIAAIAQLSTEELETILLHELVHIKRYDYVVNILQTVVETMLFFNPFVWMVSAITRREREHCCDDQVLAHTREPLSYASALAVLASHPVAVSTFTVAASGQSNHLFHRIKRIMEMKKNQFSYSRMVAAILIVTTITCSIAFVTPSFARDKGDKPAEPATTTSINSNDHGENQLISQLLADHLIDEVKGFVVERKQDKLYIDGKQQTDEIANKYLASIEPQIIRVEVFPFSERLKMHPSSGILELIAPVSFSSPCVRRYTPKKPGC